MEKKVELTVTIKGLMITAIIFVLLDIFATWLVAKADLGLFILNEVNVVFKWTFLQIGWYAFLIYPLFQISLYYGLICLTFALFTYFKEQGKRVELFKPSFYFCMALLSFHIWVIANNFLLFVRIENLK
jgi:hypothetical protein